MPMTVPVLDAATGPDQMRTVDLPDELFDVEVNNALIHQVVVTQLALARQGTSSTLTRGEVRGGGRKPHRQKGTGRARQGSSRSPQFTGGGVVHGPQPRCWSPKVNKKMRQAALRAALSDRAREGRVHVVDALVTADTPSTREAAARLAAIAGRQKVLAIVHRTDQVAWRSIRNLKDVHPLDPGQLNVYDVLVSDHVVFTEPAIRDFISRVQRPQKHARRHQPKPDGAPTATTAPSPLETVIAPTSRVLQHDLASIAAEAMERPGIEVFTRETPHVQFTAYESSDVDVVSVERRHHFVLATWPSTLTAAEALRHFEAIDSLAGPIQNLYLTFWDEPVHVRGDRVDWAAIGRESERLVAVRAEMPHETMSWRLPLVDDERDPRFAFYEASLESRRVTELLRLTAGDAVRELVKTIFGEDPWSIPALAEPA